MKCSVCGKEFEAERSTARFCSGSCKLKSHRGISVTSTPLSVTKDVTVTPVSVTEQISVTDIRPSFMPNWKRNGFKTKEEAMKFAIALTIKRVPGAGISYQNTFWDSGNVDVSKVKLEPLF